MDAKRAQELTKYARKQQIEKMMLKYNLDDEFWDMFDSYELDEESQRLDKLSRFGQKPHYITVTQSMLQLTKNKKQDK